MGLRIIITGGRDVFELAKHSAFLDTVHAKYTIVEVIQGGAMGVDSMGKLWALKNAIDLVEYPFNHAQGPSGGMRRNARMLAYLLSTDVYKTAHNRAVVAFPGNQGTANMVAIAEKAQVKILHYRAVSHA